MTLYQEGLRGTVGVGEFESNTVARSEVLTICIGLY